jgi:hypothetical protein
MQLARINQWGSRTLDTSVLGRALHRGYHIVAPKVFVPAIKQQGTVQSRYFQWTFEQGVNMLRGKKYNKLSILNSAAWIGIMTVVGAFTSAEAAERSWKGK